MNLTGSNLRGACLIAADLSEASLNGVDCIGADFRDTGLRGAYLSGRIFLTQVQLNTAKDDKAPDFPRHSLGPCIGNNPQVKISEYLN
jgi:Uncharacterized low-complexity proteins